MTNALISQVGYGNGVFMLAIFGLVCIGLIAAVLVFLFTDKKKESNS